MRNLAAPGWLFAFGLLTALPAGVAAQNDTGQPVGQEDNTSYGTTSAEFLLLGAGARGTALGGSFAAIATDISSLYYNPAGAALIEKVAESDDQLFEKYVEGAEISIDDLKAAIRRAHARTRVRCSGLVRTNNRARRSAP